MGRERDVAEIRERLLERYAGGARLWLHWTYWEFGGRVQRSDVQPDPAKAPTIELLSEMLKSGDILAGVPKGWFGFEPWDLSPEESIERIRRGWDGLGERTPNHGDVAAFTMPEERKARWESEHPKSAEEVERVRGRANLLMDGLFDELAEVPEVAEDWEEMGEYARDAYSYDWQTVLIANDLIALEKWHREGLLSDEQEERYGRLKEALREVLPMLERLDVQVPGEIMDE